MLPFSSFLMLILLHLVADGTNARRKERSLETFTMDKLDLPADCGSAKYRRSITHKRSPHSYDLLDATDYNPPHLPDKQELSRRLFRSTRRSPRIRDAISANRSFLPSLVQVIGQPEGSPDFELCSGTIIHERVVLTAAHCVSKHTNLIVITSEQFRRDPSEVSDKHRVVYHCHPKDPREDVGMLVLERPIKFGELHRAACLDSNKLSMYEGAISAGFACTGDTEQKDRTSPGFSAVLSVPNCILPGWEERFSYFRPLISSVSNAWCSGDSGGPVFRDIGRTADKRQLLTAIVSLQSDVRDESCKEGSPSASSTAANVAYYNQQFFKKWLNADQSSVNTECFKTLHNL